MRLYSAWILLAMMDSPCWEPNPEFDGPAASGGSAGSSTSTADTGMGPDSSGPSPDSGGATQGGSGTTTDQPPGTSTGEVTTAPGTSTGEVGGSSTGGCTMCGDVCVDTDTDRNHCGMCDHKCTPPNQTQCVDGECVPI